MQSQARKAADSATPSKILCVSLNISTGVIILEPASRDAVQSSDSVDIAVGLEVDHDGPDTVHIAAKPQVPLGIRADAPGPRLAILPADVAGVVIVQAAS
jgi:hypothetical protein